MVGVNTVSEKPTVLRLCTAVTALQAPPGVFLQARAVCGSAGVLVVWDGCEVRLCDPYARVTPCVPCVSRHP